MYNLIEYSDNYSDSTASLYQFERQEQNFDNAGNIIDISVNGSTSCIYKSDLSGKPTNLVNDVLTANTNPTWKNGQIIVPLKYFSSFFRSLELPLINTKLYIQLNWTKSSVISDNAGNSSFKITKTEFYVPVVTLNTEDNNKLNQLLDSEFKRTV